MKQKSSSAQLIIGFIVAAIVVVVAVVLILNSEKTAAQPKGLPQTEGIRYITDQEAVDPAPIEEQIFVEDNKLSQEELLAQFAEDPDKIWKTLKDYDVLIMGDSRAQCFLLYELMDEQHCLVMHSTTIYTIRELLDDVEERKPRVIVISYGINDVGLYHDDGVEKYMQDFAGLIEDLRERDPGVIIYVNSIIPCLESEYDRAPNWMAIPEWNKYIKNYCEEHGIGYIDVTQICKEHEDLYIDDGVHLQEEFYPYWGSLLASQIASDLSAMPENAGADDRPEAAAEAEADGEPDSGENDETD